MLSARPFTQEYGSTQEVPAVGWENGLRLDHAPTMFREAMEFYAMLPENIDAWGRGLLASRSLRSFARSRRRHLHRLLDTALDLVEEIGAVERGVWS